jgi:uncharacterized membrane protein
MPQTLLKKRIESIDLLKGMVMVVMALDHIRDYFHWQSYYFNPVDPTQTNLPVFFSRFATHYCAPTFCFLAGLSAFMSGRKKSKRELSVFLLQRGVWLIIMELTLVNFAWQFDPYFRINGIAVIGELGFSMIFLAGALHLNRNLLLALCCIIIFGHNLLDGIRIPGSFIWAMIHQEEVFTLPSGFKFYAEYPLLPWIAVMSLGYCFGPFYDSSFDSLRRKRLFTLLGLSAIGLFLVLKWINIYGDPTRWTNLHNTTGTLVSFLNVTKYPPSLLYLLITLGPALLFLGNTEELRGRMVNFFTVFGRVPFFYYLIHLYLIHLLAALAAWLSGFGDKLLVLPDWILELPGMKGYGFSLGVVYLVWFTVIAITYPLCRSYGQYKERHKGKWWLSYL